MGELLAEATQRNSMIGRRIDEDETIQFVIEDFLKRLRRGERPTIAEYCDKYPSLRDEIYSLLRTVEFADDPVAMLMLFLAEHNEK